MAKSPTPRLVAETEPAVVSRRGKPQPVPAALVEQLARARTVNEMSLIVGLKPIKGRSGPKLAY